MRCVQISTSDDRMDCREMFHGPLNPCPQKCEKCGFPDLDHVAQPCFLVKSRTLSPNELAGAEQGNFFIRERVRRVFDALVPGLCDYFPTCHKGTATHTPWLLAVPRHQAATAKVKPAIPRCGSCGEPRSAHPGSQWTESLLRALPRDDGWSCELDHDIVKSATWGSSERGWDHWTSRNLYMSVRLLALLKKIKAGGFHEATCKKTTSPDKHELAWIKEKLQLLAAAGIPLHADGTLSDDDARWLRGYLKAPAPADNARRSLDIKTAERRVKAKLPRSYVDFISTAGPASFSFANFDEQEGLAATLLWPDELGIEECANDFEEDDDDSRAVNPLTFAKTSDGDSFCFDVQKGKKEYAVFHWKREHRFLEPYADNFAACIRRFVGT